MTKKKIASKIFMFLLLLPFFEPPYFNEISSLNILFSGWLMLSTIIAILLYFKNNKLSKYMILIILYGIVLIFTTAISEYGVIKTAISEFINIFGLSLIIEYYAKKNSKLLIQNLLIIFEIYILINLFTILVYPNGLYMAQDTGVKTYWFLGHDNQHLKYLLIGCCLSFLYSIMNFNKIRMRTILLFIISTVTVIFRKSGTALFSWPIFLFLILIYILYKKEKKLIPSVFFNINIASFFAVVILRIQKIFKYIIVDLLNKNLTFTGRIYIWDTVMEYIKNSLFFGYGMESRAIKLSKFSKSGAVDAVNGHNLFLETMYMGGIFLIILLLIIIKTSIKELGKHKNDIVSKILSITIFVLLISTLTESYYLSSFIIIFTLGYNVKYFVSLED